MIYNVTWLTSKTKQIYSASKNSEVLMSYLEERLINSNVVELIGEHPVPDKGREYGVIIYYYTTKPKRRLLSAAPRRDHDHIHVVLFRGILSRSQLLENKFEVGNSADPQPDIKVHTKTEIDILVELIQKNLQQI